MKNKLKVIRGGKEIEIDGYEYLWRADLVTFDYGHAQKRCLYYLDVENKKVFLSRENPEPQKGKMIAEIFQIAFDITAEGNLSPRLGVGSNVYYSKINPVAYKALDEILRQGGYDN